MKNSAQDLINALDLESHPEGGYFKETYRSDGEISKGQLGEAFTGKRNYSTCIYFLLTSDNFSAFHKINQDEIWHFYDGSPIRLHIISKNGSYSNHSIGIDIQNGELPQYVVKAGDWFAAEVEDENSFTLLGCTVSPGFSFEDFELGSRAELISQFPEHHEIIKALTRE